MGTLIHDRVALAREGRNPFVIAKLPTGWAVMGDRQPLPGYCLFLADPVVESINVLNEAERAAYSLDCVRIGDALLQTTGAYRINYETWGNTEAALHTHIVPRYREESEAQRRLPACLSYDWETALEFSQDRHGALLTRLRAFLTVT